MTVHSLQELKLTSQVPELGVPETVLSEKTVNVLVTKWRDSFWTTLPKQPAGMEFNWVLIWAPDMVIKEAIVLQEAIEGTAKSLYGGNTQCWVFRDLVAVKRILRALAEGVADETIADVRVDNDELSVLTCDLGRYDLSFETGFLKGIPPETRQNFVLSPWGNRLRWDSVDLDVNAHSIRFECDEAYRLQYLVKASESRARLGSALRMIREEREVKQAGFTRMNEREVRRIEKGDVGLSVKTIENYAHGLGLTSRELLDRLSEKLEGLGR